jgi:Xaa-Pro aminopeptidase
MVNSQFTALEATHCELVALIMIRLTLWHDRPPAPAVQSAKCRWRSAVKAAAKRARIAQVLAKEGVDLLAITQPDNIAWLLNIRGRMWR